ncbi:hypothetical protein H4582DRAFT_2076348 [Lactarius indigo]|nr:hypothetical protein H4582DRAFT_2076348 [Lactarius indigo]
MSSIPPCTNPHLWGSGDADMLSPHERTFATHARAVNTAIQLQFESVLHQQRPLGSPHDEARAAQFSPLETTAFTDAQKAKLARHGNASGGKQDIHNPPRQCPLCHYEWTRAYKIKAHLLKVHSDELCPAVSTGIRGLRGHDVVKFIDTYELLRSFETPDIMKSLSKVVL